MPEHESTSDKITTGAIKGIFSGTGIARIFVPVAITMDTIRLGMSIREDFKRSKRKRSNGTKRKVPKKTIKCASSIAGGWGGGFGGGALGAAIGTSIFPVVGTLIGGIIGGIAGGVTGTLGAEAVTEAALDEVESTDVESDTE